MRRSRRIAAALAATGVAVGVWPGAPADALAPDAVAYWVIAQTKAPPDPLTTPLPAADPVVPKNGLYVANTADGPSAISAVQYTVDGRMSATLVLNVHSYAAPPEQAPAPPGQAPAPTTPNASLITIAACVTDPWVPPPPGEPGAWEERPRRADDCVGGQWAADGSNVTFDLGAQHQISDDQFNLVIVPVPAANPVPDQPPANRPFSVVFSPPREESLEPGEPDDGFFEEDEPDEDFDFDIDTGTDFPSVEMGPTDPGVPSIISPPVTTKTTPTTQRRATLPRQTRPVAALPGDGRGERIMAMSLLMALAVGWWWFGGQQSRGPQLLGSLGGPGRGTGRSSEPLSGIGRFARPRTGRPRRLL